MNSRNSNPKSPKLKTNNETKINKTPPKLKIPTSLPNQMGDLSPSDFSDNEQDWKTVSPNPVKRVRFSGHATSPLSKKDTSIFTSANRFSLLALPKEDTQLVMQVTEQPQTPTEQPQTSTITIPPNFFQHHSKTKPD